MAWEVAALNLNAENAEAGNVMLPDQVSPLPLNGRNFIDLTTLPGTAMGREFDNKNNALRAGGGISISGTPAKANQWRVNGANHNGEGSHQAFSSIPG